MKWISLLLIPWLAGCEITARVYVEKGYNPIPHTDNLNTNDIFNDVKATAAIELKKVY